MRRIAFLIALTVGGAAFAAPQDPRQSFEEFRRSLLQEHSDFRSSVLEDYARFLDGVWEEHQSFRGLRRDETPKPTAAPKAPVSLELKPARLPEPAPAPEPAPKAEPAAAPKPAAGVAAAPFDFYGISLNVADCRPALTRRLNDGAEFAAQWRSLLKDPQAARLADALAATAADLGLNDYLTFDLVCRYVADRYPSAHSSARAALAHFLLTSMGYDIRLGLSGGEGLLLVPVSQTVYGRPYMTIGGEKFYVFASDSKAIGSGSPISTCKLPADAQTGRKVDMRFNRPLNLPRKPRSFALEYGGIRLSGELNENLFPMLYRYPQTDMAAYAESNLDPQLRAELVGQLKEQLAGRPTLDAVNALLAFTQSALDYASDEVSHRFEKPYFLEEWLYYPVNDCEDRSIFYSYMLWNVLGVENQMLTFPGHESVAVALDEPIAGDSYESAGRTFYISDPTYIGAVTGMCMPDCQNVTPEIEYHFKK